MLRSLLHNTTASRSRRSEYGPLFHSATIEDNATRSAIGHPLKLQTLRTVPAEKPYPTLSSTNHTETLD